MSKRYTAAFFEGLNADSARSAEVIVPLVLHLVPARSVVDVGCGEGVWLAAFLHHGVPQVLGIDGDYVDRARLHIPPGSFRQADLSKPLTLERTFDLAVSLEVAEHLPPQCAAPFVESLTNLAPVVLFSAAIPFQGGVHHLNEQWPDEWAQLFRKRDYLAVDSIRKLVWENEAVGWWYAQNVLLFVRRDVLESNAGLQAGFELTNTGQLRLVHPSQYLYLHAHPASGLKAATRIWWQCLKNAVTARTRWIRGGDLPAAGRSSPRLHSRAENR